MFMTNRLHLYDMDESKQPAQRHPEKLDIIEIPIDSVHGIHCRLSAVHLVHCKLGRMQRYDISHGARRVDSSYSASNLQSLRQPSNRRQDHYHERYKRLGKTEQNEQRDKEKRTKEEK